MSYTITITEEWEPETATMTATEAAADPGKQTRQIYSQTVDALDLPAVLKAVNGMGKRTRPRKNAKG